MNETFVRDNYILSSDEKKREGPDCVVVIAHSTVFTYINNVQEAARGLMQDIFDVAREESIPMSGFGKYINTLNICGGIRRTDKQSDDIVDKAFVKVKQFCSASGTTFLWSCISRTFETIESNRLTKKKRDIKFNKCKIIFLVNFDKQEINSIARAKIRSDSGITKFKDCNWADVVVVNLSGYIPEQKLSFKMITYDSSSGKKNIRENIFGRTES